MVPVLAVTDLVKRYGRFRAVEGATFAVAPGTIGGLLGPNGSGKSSILHSITGVVSLTSGSIEISGLPHGSAAAKAMTGFVPDDLALPMNLTGFEYLDLVRRLQPRADAELGKELADLLNLGSALPKLVAEYSHGMKRKIQMIAALFHGPALLILDEPFRGLDPEANLILRQLIKSFVRDGGGVLIATHDLTAAQGYCDTVTIVDAGRVVADGPPDALIEEYRQDSLEEVFLMATGIGSRTREVQERLSRIRIVGRERPLDRPTVDSTQKGS